MGKGGAASWRALGGLSAVLAAVVARKLATSGWKLVTGREPPVNPEDPDVTWQEALGWAVASGALIGVARLLAARKAANYYRRSTGSLPPNLNKAS